MPASTDEPLNENTHITAFVIDSQGEPSIECWEFGSLDESTQVTGTDGSKATTRSISLAQGGELDYCHILVFAPRANIRFSKDSPSFRYVA